MTTLTEFDRLGRLASFHYADDSCEEWDMADNAKAKALELFDAHPDLRPQMREMAKRFLWSLSMERPCGD